MWIFTQTGFYSAVEDWDDASKVFVRARAKADLERFRQTMDVESTIVETPDRDYPFRIHIAKTDLIYALVAAVCSLDYHNFKDRVKEVDPSRVSALMSVWSTMHAIEAPRPKAVDEKQFYLFRELEMEPGPGLISWANTGSGDPRGADRRYGREECETCGSEKRYGECPECDWLDPDQYHIFDAEDKP